MTKGDRGHHDLGRRLRHWANDVPGRGLGDGGERLHYWVFAGPWSYGQEIGGEANGVDREFLDRGRARMGAVIGGRNTFEAAGRWGGSNPFPAPFFVVTHHPHDAPSSEGFVFVDGLAAAIEQAKPATGERDVVIMGGADIIRQALGEGYVEELTITTAPVILGRGKRLFEAFDEDIDLEPKETLTSRFATLITYRVIG